MKNRSDTYTFVFTDIEGSTKLLRALGDTYTQVLRDHDSIIRTATNDHGGEAFGSEGDAQNLVFRDAGSAIGAAVDAQRALARHEWPEGHSVRVRMGIHSGQATREGGDFVGMSLHETARIASAGHGGQVLLSPATQELARTSMPQGVGLRDLGEHRLKDVEAPLHIFQLLIDGLDRDFPPLRTLGGVRADLPEQLSSFVGRAEIESVISLTDDSRLVTLTGPGGTGKTRLAIQVASLIADRFDDGTHFVGLDAVTDPELVMSEVALVLSIAAGSSPPLERVIEHLRDRSMLLVLDNFEQVVDAAPSVATLLKACPAVRVIATSRVPLRVSGEQEFPVPALSFPTSGRAIDIETAGEFEAIRLFVERAQAVRPDFTLDDATTTAVVDIVARLDGLPLALELAAARLRMLTLSDLLGRIEAGIGVLSGGKRDVPHRQRTLRAAIEWSHDLLDASDRRLFARFSVMSGGAALTHIESVCGSADEPGADVFDALESLTDQSLIRMSEDIAGEARFAMLMTIREYAAERLRETDESERLHRRHARVFLELAEEAAPGLVGPEAADRNDRLEVEHDNLRAAFDWSIAAGDAEVALRLGTALWRFWQVRGHLVEGTRRLDRALALPTVRDQPASILARAEGAAGSVAYWRGERIAMHRHYAAALGHAREAGDPGILAEALYNMGFAPTEVDAPVLEQYQAGKPYFEEALAQYRELDDRTGMAGALWALAEVANAGDDLVEAARLAQETLVIARELGDPFTTGWAAFTLSWNQLMQGQGESGTFDLMEEALAVFERSGDTGGLTMMMGTVLIVAVKREDPERWLLWGAANRLADESGTNRWAEDPRARPYFLEPQTEEEDKAVAAGRRMTTVEALVLARRVLDRARST